MDIRAIVTMQAIILAAGMGKRLGDLTRYDTKCMLTVAGRRLVDRAVDSISKAGIRDIVVVIGYMGDRLSEYLEERYSDSDLRFTFVENRDYATTNNIYSLHLARSYLESDDTILLESDIVFDPELIPRLVSMPERDVVVVADYRDWMDGTVVECDDDGSITRFVEKREMDYDSLDRYHKTVNVYKFSKEFSRDVYVPLLETYMSTFGTNNYYEIVLKVVVEISNTSLSAFEVGDMPWYEIDDAQDYDIATAIFSEGDEKYRIMMSKYGGYWRYDGLLDYVYLVNPYFPPERYLRKMENRYRELLGSYPSGEDVQNLNAARMFGIDQGYILTGNGASELINAIGRITSGTMAVGVPTFNEYIRCFEHCGLREIDNSEHDFGCDKGRYLSALDGTDCLCIVSPDNPSGAMLSKEDMMEILTASKDKGVRLIVDESFIDFAERDIRYTLLDNDILKGHPNLIVVKSIGKSFGVAGLRLGVIACSDPEVIASVRRNMQVWNVNSFGEYFLQTFNLFASDYWDACDRIAEERARLDSMLSRIPRIRTYRSQANFIMFSIDGVDSRKVCVDVLERHNIILKDLSTKDHFDGRSYIRVAVRDRDDNDRLISALMDVLSKM